MSSSMSPLLKRREEKESNLRTIETAENEPVHTNSETSRMNPILARLHERTPRPMQPLDDVDYFDSLLSEIRLLAKNPVFRHAHLSLMEEVYTVWTRLRGNLAVPMSPRYHIGRPSALKRSTPPNSGSSIDGTPPNKPNSRSSVVSPGLSPSLKLRFARGDIVAPINWLGHMDGNTQDLPIYIHKLEKKVFVPENPNYNFIGRILGPRGISARQIEAETNCKILIRGKGSVKDPIKERKLIGQQGYEHLSENLHVHISTEGSELADCQRRMDKAVSIIESLLTPAYDAYKKTQLLQLAIINGTYRPYKKQKSRY